MQHQRLASPAAMLADPSRAAMVLALMDGRPRSAKKLAIDAGVTPQTASAHLRKLLASSILVYEEQGREKHFRLASAEVAQAVEALSGIGAGPLPAAARELRFARCCYDHLAGRLGVAVTQRLFRAGNTILEDLGINVSPTSRRPLFRCCTDWTERRPHVAGAIGAALLRHFKEQGWLATVKESRKLVVTPRGRESFVRVLGVDAALFS